MMPAVRNPYSAGSAPSISRLDRHRNVDKVTRRAFIGRVGAATVISAAARHLGAAARAPAPQPRAAAALETSAAPGYRFFTAGEARFIESACERLIPADERAPGALDAGVPHYLDRQLGGAWGAGERLYRSGPWQPGSPPPGYPALLTPGDLFRRALRAIGLGFEARGAAFEELPVEAQTAYLKFLEAGAADLDGVPSAVFFDMLLKMTMEGFFSHPRLGASRSVVAWPLVGFPGAFADGSVLARRAVSG